MDRRRVLTGMAVVAGAALAGQAAWAAEDPTQAAEFIRQTGNRLAQVIGDASTDSEKRQRLEPFLAEITDINAVAQFCLGRFWRTATPAQRTEFVQLFHTILLNNIVTRLSDYRPGTPIKVVTGQPLQHEDGVYVPTTVEREGAPPLKVTWVVASESGSPKLVDVVAEGMSLRLTQRSDYASFINHNGGSIDVLLAAMRKQAAGDAAAAR